ncbi:DUF3944 domain-containing protein [Glaesserella parasuis]|uniref:DUF3944 domain-containing protein n=1 Tax=Glaesserella parasuis TaxID=738 RepID=UPI002436EB15|nr:DUF3944 domain-containing protein [Glaesserella parasuis]MDG6340211.1 DUF3944 domain-containing protein [Glaesserella parasuis]
MAYLHDYDLEFLKDCRSNELDDLVYVLTHDKDGSPRLTETLTTTDKYKRYFPQHNAYWDEIAEEIQYFGGNTFTNLVKGHGVVYKEILCDVCKKLKVKYKKTESTRDIENALLMKILQTSLEKLSDQELTNLSIELGIDKAEFVVGGKLKMAAFQALFKAGSFKSYQLTAIIANAVMKALTGKGLTFVANSGMMKILSALTGPIGITINILAIAVDIAGPAFRVTIPAVIQIAYLRKLTDNRQEIEERLQTENAKSNESKVKENEEMPIRSKEEAELEQRILKGIKKLREQHHFTQAMMAQELNISTAEYILYESGKKTLNVRLVKMIADIFNISTADLAKAGEITENQTVRASPTICVNTCF